MYQKTTASVMIEQGNYIKRVLDWVSEME